MKLQLAGIVAGAVMSLALGGHAGAAEIERVPLGAGAVPIAAAVVVPAGYDLVYLSGSTAPLVDKSAPAGSTQAYGGGTEAQAAAALDRQKATLEGLGLSFGDVVAAHVFLVGDPAKGGEIDFAGLNAAWSRVFGAPGQPNKPARSTVKVAGLVAPGALVEIELIAARKPAGVR